MLNRVMARVSATLLQNPATYRIRIAIVMVMVCGAPTASSSSISPLLRRLLIHHTAEGALIHRLYEFGLHGHLRIR